MEPGELQKALALLVSALDNLDIHYFIGGSVASSLFGLPRSTMDIDIVTDLKKSHVQPLTALLKNDYYIDPDVILKAIDRKSSCNIIHLDTMMKIDIFILKDRRYDRAAFARKTIDNMGAEPDSVSYHFCSKEDIVLSKLEWYKMGGEVSERQWKDVIGVLKIQGEKIDYTYLKRWAKELALDVLLKKAVNEIRTP